MKILILLSLTFVTSISTIQAQNISDQEFASIKRLSESVKKLCPPDTCIVIGIGRSPTPITTYLKAEKENYSWNLPLSCFRHGVSQPKLRLEDKELLHQHFDRYIPSLKEIAGKSILVIDYSVQGHSLIAAINHLEEYFKKKSEKLEKSGELIPTPRIEAAAFVESHNKDGLKRSTSDSINFLITFQLKDELISRYMTCQAYDQFAQYKSYFVLDRKNENLENSSYPKFLKLMQQLQMKSEPAEEELFCF